MAIHHKACKGIQQPGYSPFIDTRTLIPEADGIGIQVETNPVLFSKREDTAMKLQTIALLLLSVFSSSFSVAKCNSLLDYETRKLRSEETVNLCEAYQGKVIVMVNTASQCGFTPQFKSLEQLYQRYKEQGLVVLGFPSNDFQQEHKSESKTADVCYVNYGVTFQMLATSHVTGEHANPVFKQLAQQTGQSPRWNFNKFIVGKDGKAIKYFPSSELPLGGDLEKSVVEALGI